MITHLRPGATTRVPARLGAATRVPVRLGAATGRVRALAAQLHFDEVALARFFSEVTSAEACPATAVS